MAKKQKQKEKLFEEVQFQDIERAKREVKFAKVNQIRILIGFVFSFSPHLQFGEILKKQVCL